MRRIITTVLIFGLGLSMFPEGASLARPTRPGGYAVTDRRDDVLEYDADLGDYVPSDYPIDIFLMRFSYSTDTEARVLIKFHELGRTVWNKLTTEFNIGGKPITVVAFRNGSTLVEDGSDNVIECDVRNRYRRKVKIVVVGVPSNCLGSPAGIDQTTVSIFSTDGDKYDSVQSMSPFSAP